MNEQVRAGGGAQRVGAMVAALGGLGSRGIDCGTAQDADRAQARELLAQLGELERLKAAAAAAQARVTAAFVQVSEGVEAQRRERAAQLAQRSGADGFTVWRARNGRTLAGPGVGAQVALARRLSPHQGARALTFAQTLADSMPETLTALSAGVLSERRAQTIVRESSHLGQEHRALVDAEVAGDPTIGSWGDREVERRTRAAVYALDPAGRPGAGPARGGRATGQRPPGTGRDVPGLRPATPGPGCRGVRRATARRGLSPCER